jgi:hypothetical protein
VKVKLTNRWRESLPRLTRLIHGAAAWARLDAYQTNEAAATHEVALPVERLATVATELGIGYD